MFTDCNSDRADSSKKVSIKPKFLGLLSTSSILHTNIFRFIVVLVLDTFFFNYEAIKSGCG